MDVRKGEVLGTNQMKTFHYLVIAHCCHHAGEQILKENCIQKMIMVLNTHKVRKKKKRVEFYRIG